MTTTEYELQSLTTGLILEMAYRGLCNKGGLELIENHHETFSACLKKVFIENYFDVLKVIDDINLTYDTTEGRNFSLKKKENKQINNGDC